MTTTETYTRTHRALLTVARDHGLVPADVRILVALHDRDGKATTSDLYDDIGDPTAVRRSLGTLYATDTVVGTAPDGGPRRPGQSSHLTLTGKGADIAHEVLVLVGAERRLRAAA